jgi:hypothetical protein
MNKTFDLTPFIVKTAAVQNQEIEQPSNFEAYIGKIKKSVDSCRTQFGMAREFCGHRDGYDSCAHPTRKGMVMILCKMEICPFLKSTS